MNFCEQNVVCLKLWEISIKEQMLIKPNLARVIFQASFILYRPAYTANTQNEGHWNEVEPVWQRVCNLVSTDWLIWEKIKWLPPRRQALGDFRGLPQAGTQSSLQPSRRTCAALQRYGLGRNFTVSRGRHCWQKMGGGTTCLICSEFWEIEH